MTNIQAISALREIALGYAAIETFCGLICCDKMYAVWCALCGVVCGALCLCAVWSFVFVCGVELCVCVRCGDVCAVW